VGCVSRGGIKLLDFGKHALTDVEVDERLHRLGVLLGEQAVEAADVDEVHEAGVQVAVGGGVPEEQPVRPVEVRVAAEHLLVPVE
jgi:hypothetical protein